MSVPLPRFGKAFRQEVDLRNPVTCLARHLKLPPKVTWLVLSVVLFLAGAAHFAIQGQDFLAKIGVDGAIAAVAMIVSFAG